MRARTMLSVALCASIAAIPAVVVPAGAASPPPAPALPHAKVKGPLDGGSGPAQAAGLIVTTRAAHPSASLKAAAAGLDAGLTPLGAGVSVVRFDEPTSAAAAQELAAGLEARGDVLDARPDWIVRTTAASPVPTNDAYFDLQWNLWDADATTRTGGFGVHAPYGWRTTKGDRNVRVAVLDTGYVAHPDLQANVVSGWDFVSDPSAAADGNGWDSNPADPGDACDGDRSSWHGTFVAGEIAAVTGNGTGVASIAPNVSVQPVRVLGRCGGTISDLIAAITWASGGSVPGVPTQKPADVINMSLGGTAPSCDPGLANAIAGARARGTVVVAAAGNEALPISMSSPANCPDVFTVTATDIFGATTTYSNYGTSYSGNSAADIAAPGGDVYSDIGVLGIAGLSNTGTAGPVSPGYVQMIGTSMAAPHVAAAAALLRSANRGLSVATIESRMQATAAPFPVYSSWNCTVLDCGAGILDMKSLISPSMISVAAPPVVQAATAGIGQAKVSWTRPATAIALTGYQVNVGGRTCTTTGTTCTVAGLRAGTYSALVRATFAGGAGSWSKAAAVAVVASPGQPRALRAKLARKGKATITWAAPVSNGGTPIVRYEYRWGASVKAALGKARSVAAPKVSISKLKPGQVVRFQTRAVTKAGASGWSALTFRYQP